MGVYRVEYKPWNSFMINIPDRLYSFSLDVREARNVIRLYPYEWMLKVMRRESKHALLQYETTCCGRMHCKKLRSNSLVLIGTDFLFRITFSTPVCVPFLFPLVPEGLCMYYMYFPVHKVITMRQETLEASSMLCSMDIHNRALLPEWSQVRRTTNDLLQFFKK